MNREELVSKFSQTVGVDKATQIVETAAAELDVADRESFSSGEVRDLCDEIQHAHDGYVSEVATEIRVHEQAEERFRALLQNIPDPAVVVEFEGDEPILRTVNDAFERTFGHGTEAAGERLSDLIEPPNAESASDIWFRSDEYEEVEVHRLTADGEERTFLFRAALANRAGGAVEGYGIYTDITARERRERQLQHQNQQLERFVSVVSHDLRNPLNVASGNLALALEMTDDPEVTDRLEAIDAAHDQMGELIEDLLTLAKQGRTVGETEPVDLAEVVRAAWAHVQTPEATLSLDVDGPPIAADENRLGELLQNLFRNAVEHAGRDVTVSVGRFDDRRRGFYVADDGPGVPEDERDDVFEFGFSTADEGTGFGLSIVESIAEAHGWAVSLTAGEDGGARFEFTNVKRT